MYDWAHGQSRLASRGSPTPSAPWSSRTTARSTTGISKPCGIYHPQQIEFARLNLTYTVMSKRKLLELVRGAPRRAAGTTRACPRSPACAGAATRRRPSATSASASAWPRPTAWSTSPCSSTACARTSTAGPRAPWPCCGRCGWSSTTTPRDRSRNSTAVNNPEDPAAGTRKVPFSRVLYIERDDFREDPPKKYFRLSPGAEVRLRYAYLIKCTDCGEGPRHGRGGRGARHLRSRHARGQTRPTAARSRGTIHWVSADSRRRCRGAPVRPPLREARARTAEEDWKSVLNPASLERLTGCKLEPSLAGAAPGNRYQFERNGYFCADRVDSSPGKLVFNRTVSLRDSWAKIERGVAG